MFLVPVPIPRPEPFCVPGHITFHLPRKHIRRLVRLSHAPSTTFSYTGLQELLRDSGLAIFKLEVTPLPINLKLRKDNSTPFSNPKRYKSLIGKLNFLTHMKDPFEIHFQALQQTLYDIHATVS